MTPEQVVAVLYSLFSCRKGISKNLYILVFSYTLRIVVAKIKFLGRSVWLFIKRLGSFHVRYCSYLR